MRLLSCTNRGPVFQWFAPLRPDIHPINYTCRGEPDHLRHSSFAESTCAGVKGGADGENIIHQQDGLAFQFFRGRIATKE